MVFALHYRSQAYKAGKETCITPAVYKLWAQCSSLTSCTLISSPTLTTLKLIWLNVGCCRHMLIQEFGINPLVLFIFHSGDRLNHLSDNRNRWLTRSLILRILVNSVILLTINDGQTWQWWWWQHTGMLMVLTWQAFCLPSKDGISFLWAWHSIHWILTLLLWM